MFAFKGLLVKTVWLMTILASTSSSANNRDLIMFSSDAPPHMIAATKGGIDIDIVKTILREMGHKVTVEFSPLKRAMEQLKKKEADVFLPTFFKTMKTTFLFPMHLFNTDL